jgi:hypothetical protein
MRILGILYIDVYKYPMSSIKCQKKGAGNALFQPVFTQFSPSKPVEVDALITRRTPPRSVHAAFPHTALYKSNCSIVIHRY